MIAAGIAIAVIALVLALVVAVGLEPGPSPGDVAVSYELAWDRLDFDALWALSGDELRDGRSRGDFMNDKREAYAGTHIRKLIYEGGDWMPLLPKQVAECILEIDGPQRIRETFRYSTPYGTREEGEGA